MTAQLDYLLILDSQDRPILFKAYKRSEDDVNIQLHCYSSLDFLSQKIQKRNQQYLGKIYTIYNQLGEYSIYAFYTITKIKILAIFKQQIQNPNQEISQQHISQFCFNVYKLYKKQLLQAFSIFQSTGRFTKRFYQQLDAYVAKTKFAIVNKK